MQFLYLLLLVAIKSSLFSIDISSIDGNPIHLQNYEGKKILLSSITDTGRQVNQLRELESLFQQHKDSLVVIGLPLSENHDPAEIQRLKTVFRDSLHLTFPISVPLSPADVEKAPILSWLEDKEQNKMTGYTVKAPFTKFLISRTGHLYGIFRNTINPVHPLINETIRDAGE